MDTIDEYIEAFRNMKSLLHLNDMPVLECAVRDIETGSDLDNLTLDRTPRFVVAVAVNLVEGTLGARIDLELADKDLISHAHHHVNATFRHHHLALN